MVPSGTHLKINSNSTRRVRWFEKLGFKRLNTAPNVSLRSISFGGGLICRVNVLVQRVYPVVYIEKTEDGKKVTRNARTEQKAAAAFQQQQENVLEQLCSQLQRDIMSEKSKTSSKRRIVQITEDALAQISSPEELCHFLENFSDPSIESMLTDEQKQIIQSYQESRRACADKILQDRIQSVKVKKRDVNALLRIKVGGVLPEDNKFALLSWWQPPEDITNMLVEGRVISLYNVVPGKSPHQLYLNSTKQSRIKQLCNSSNERWQARTVTHICDISPKLQPAFNELDVVGLVVYIHQVTNGKNKLETVYLTDTGQTFFGLVFWRGLEEYSYENVITEGCIICISNVQWRKSSSTCAIPCGYVNETTAVSHNPKSSQMRQALEALKNVLDEEDIPALIEKCQDNITNVLGSFRNRTNSDQNTTLPANVSRSSELNSSFNKSLTEETSSPSGRPQYVNGFALKPRATSTPVRTPVQRRLERLEQYGQLPAVTPLPLKSSSRFSKNFQSPSIVDSPPMEL